MNVKFTTIESLDHPLLDDLISNMNLLNKEEYLLIDKDLIKKENFKLVDIDKNDFDFKREKYIVGIINNKIISGMKLYYENNTIMISYVFVNKELRNKGIGTNMFNFLFELYDKTFYRFGLYVFNSNSRAIDFYMKQGFTNIMTSMFL